MTATKDRGTMDRRATLPFLLLLVHGALSARAPAAEEGGQVKGSAGDRGPGLKRQALPALELSVRRTLDLAHVDPAQYAAALGKDPVRIFEFVRDQIAYQAYAGSLRGPRGTLLAMAGNSIDRAALLASLLASAGKTVRFVEGALAEERARELVMSMWVERPRPGFAGAAEGSVAADRALETMRAAVERDYALIRDHLKKTESVLSPERAGLDAFVREAERHYWVEWLRDGTWVELDPSFGDSTPGKTFAVRRDVLAALPDELHHRLAVRVQVEEYDGGPPSTRAVLTFAAPTADLSGTGLVLSHQPENWRGPATEVTGALSAAIEDTGRVKPVLVAGGQFLTGEPFQQRPRTAGIGGVPALLRGEGSRKPVTLASAEWVEIEIVAPGGRREVVVRELFDLVGKARRAAGRRPGPEELRKKAQAEDAFMVKDAVYDLYITTGSLDAAHFAGLNADPPGEAAGEDVLAVLRRTNITFTAIADALLSRLTRDGRSSVVLYPDSPRVQIMEFSSAGGKAQLSMDLRRTRTRAIASGDPEHAFFARAFRGVVEGTLERILLQYMAGSDEARLRSSVGTSVLFERARAEGIVTTLLAGPGARLESTLPEDTRARLKEELAAGFLIVAPERPLAAGGQSRFAWWRIDPRSGEVIAVADNGLHAEIERYIIVHNQEANTCSIVAVLRGGFRYVVDAAVYGTPYYVAMMNRIVNNEIWGATRI